MLLQVEAQAHKVAEVANLRAATLLPALVVDTFAALPFVEGCIGLLLLLGLFPRPALVAAMGVMMSLIIGSSLPEEWGHRRRAGALWPVYLRPCSILSA